MNRKMWDEGLRKQVQISLKNPGRPFNLHFYEARLDGRLRIFDIFRDDKGTSVGESLIKGTEPMTEVMVPPTISPIYTHVNYGLWKSQDPDKIMEAFAYVHGLTGVTKIHEIQFLNQMADIMAEVLLRLLINSELLN